MFCGSPTKQVAGSNSLWRQPPAGWFMAMCYLSRSFRGDAVVPDDYATTTMTMMSSFGFVFHLFWTRNSGISRTGFCYSWHPATHTHTTILQLSGLCLGQPCELVPEGTFHHLLDFLVQNEDNRQVHQQSGWTATPSRPIGVPVSAIPPFLCRMLFLANPLHLSQLGTGTK